MGESLQLASGLEHDLVRLLDRDRSVVWMVPQPCRLIFADGSKVTKHVPDLLVLTRSGDVVVWDARPTRRMDETFLRQSQRTRQACEKVGWSYEVFEGLDEVTRLNQLWLASFRSDEEWTCCGVSGCLTRQLHAPTTFGSAT